MHGAGLDGNDLLHEGCDGDGDNEDETAKADQMPGLD